MLVLKTWIGSNATAVLKNTGGEQKTAGIYKTQWPLKHLLPQTTVCFMSHTIFTLCNNFSPKLRWPYSHHFTKLLSVPQPHFPISSVAFTTWFCRTRESEERTCCTATAPAVISPRPTLTLPRSSIKYYVLPMLHFFFFPLLNQSYPKQLCDDGNIVSVVSDMVATGHKQLLSTWKVNNATKKLNF